MPVRSVPLPRGFDAAASFARFARSGEDLLERWDGRILTRAVRTAGGVVPFEAEVTADGSVLAVRTRAEPDLVAAAAAEMVERRPASWAELTASDPALRRLDEVRPGLHAVRTLDPLVALVHSITAQQVNLGWAATTRRRLAARYAEEVAVGTTSLRLLDPARLAAADVAELRALQLTTAKAHAVVALGAAVDSGALDLGSLAGMADDEVSARLVALPGIGPWTAQWYLVRVLGRPVVVTGDLAVRKAVGLLYAGGARPTPDETARLTRHWGEGAVTAQQLALDALATGALGRP